MITLSAMAETEDEDEKSKLQPITWKDCKDD
jgi:hypothetical protein